MRRFQTYAAAGIAISGIVLIPKSCSHKVEKEAIFDSESLNTYQSQRVQENIQVRPALSQYLAENGYYLSKKMSDQISSYSPQIKEGYLGRMNTDANLRKGPGIEYDYIRTLSKDEKIDVFAQCENGWYFVGNQGTLGYISGDYVEAYHPDALNRQLDRLPKICHGVRATTDVNIRRGPSTDSEIISVLDGTYSLPAGPMRSDEWIPVTYQGQAGYVYGGLVNDQKLVEDTTVIEGSWIEMVDVNRDCFLYSRPYGDSFEVIPQYQTLKVYGEAGDYYYVDCDGNLGYVRKRDCSKLTDHYVVIDYSMKKAYLYHGNQKITSTYVCLGKEETPTPLGCHQVLEKKRDTVLIGEDYAVPVEYFIRFYGQCGLHDADYRVVFGYDDTHGCVNILPDVVPTFYEELSVGDNIIVQK